MGKRWKQWQTLFSAPKSLQIVTAARHYFANKGPSSQIYGFSSSHEWMWELNHKESRAPKNWCFWNVLLEETLARPLEYEEIQPVHPKGDQSWVFIGRTDGEAETPVLRPSDLKNWLLEKTLSRERLKVGGEGDDRGWDGWMASPTWWIWAWVSSGNWWWSGRLERAAVHGLQRVGYNWATELNF